MQFKIGRVTHYYAKIGVAVIRLESELSAGERIKFVKNGEELFDQTVTSMQIGHEKVASSKAGVVAMKTKEVVREGAEVFKLQ